MGFSQGLSGLKASSTSLDVIGNNIANASTVGFKQSHAQFADLYANAMSGSASNQVGIGALVTRVQQQFTQGNLSPTNSALDLAINGNGFFRFSDNGSIVYSRNGQLELTKDGYLINAAGNRLTGYAVYANGNVATGAPTEIQITSSDIAPQITSKITSVLNLDSREDVITVTPFSVDDPLSYNHATAIDVYDSLGNMHVLQTFYVRTSDSPSQWAVYAYTDGNYIDSAGNASTIAGNVGPLGTLEFDTNGQPVTGTTLMDVTVPGINGADNFTASVNFSGTTQYGAKFSVNDNQQDGFASGRLTGFSVDHQGFIMGSYTNGKTAILGQVVLSYFRDPNGLAQLGNNMYAETLESGAPITGTPESGPLGSLQSYYVEESNVDLTQSLVDMITAQRVYQANAQTIKTEDQIMQTLVNLR